VRPYLKNSQHKKGLVEWLKWCLPSKCEALSSNPVFVGRGIKTKAKRAGEWHLSGMTLNVD
jgi:hypothetical protein